MRVGRIVPFSILSYIDFCLDYRKIICGSGDQRGRTTTMQAVATAWNGRETYSRRTRFCRRRKRELDSLRLRAKRLSSGAL